MNGAEKLAHHEGVRLLELGDACADVLIQGLEFHAGCVPLMTPHKRRSLRKATMAMLARLEELEERST